MKKAGIIILAGIVLVGCIFAAGCTVGDPIMGTWELTTPTELGTQEIGEYDNFLTFVNSGTGYQTFYGSGEKYTSTDSSTSYVSGSSSSIQNFSWTKNDNGKYTLSFINGDVDTAVYSEKTQTLTTNWGVYTKVSL